MVSTVKVKEAQAEQRKNDLVVYLAHDLDKAYRLEELVNQFFDIARFNLQTIVLQKRQINLSHMLAQLADEFPAKSAPSWQQPLLFRKENIYLVGAYRVRY